MSRRFDIPADARQLQARASDPMTSAWVAANAGAGKTHVLVQRVVRLLLTGTDPACILCLTFTKAAAANMSNRVFSTLRGWTRLSDAELTVELTLIEGKAPMPQQLALARRLFARAIETPGGLKVETIHAFCTRILHLFPFEAEVAARFEVIDERTSAEMRDELWADLLLRAGREPGGEIGRALARLVLDNADTTLAERVEEALSRRWQIDAWVANRPIHAVIEELADAFGVGIDETPEALAQNLMQSPHLPHSEWPAVAAAFREIGGARNDEQAARFIAAMQGDVSSWISAFLTARNTTKGKGWLYSGDMAKQFPDLVQRLSDEAVRVAALVARMAAARLVQRTRAIVTIVLDIHARLEARKARAGLLDFDDLVSRTTRLLANQRSQWVHYKLDQGIDHVLVDEAQDTSPQQWAVIESLTEEFAAGQSARTARRSVFVVGDEKQSIYSFQGADPRFFAEMQHRFSKRFRDAGKTLDVIAFRKSFRSTRTITAAVDQVFRAETAFKGLESVDPKPLVHEALRTDMPGEVELWPLLRAEQRAPRLAWDAPFDAIDKHDPQQQLAERIARTIRQWIASGERLGPAGPAIRPKDVLILVRQRGGLFNAIIRALQLQGVPVAGADRLRLLEALAVEDVLSLIGALLTPDDDLALAEALKSPIFGLDETQLFTLAHGRKGRLYQALADATDTEFTSAAVRLHHWRSMANQLGPFEFLAHLLGPQGIRKVMVGRLGAEADDALDELLALALQFEAAHPPTLRGFLHWLTSADMEIKRDMDAARDEVRVMTVHGAKGLEAPIVILPDTTSHSEGRHASPFVTVRLPQHNDATALVWAGSDVKDDQVIQDALATRSSDISDEHRRLLYVALTRAADRLLICGKTPRGRAQSQGCWYDLVSDALQPSASEVEADEASGEKIWRWTANGQPPERHYDRAQPALVTQDVTHPGELERFATTSTPEALTPSRHDKAGKRTTRPRADGLDPLRRGELLHRLLQAFETPPDAAMLEMILPALHRLAPDLDSAVLAGMAVDVRQLFDSDAVRAQFVAGDLREAAIRGRVVFGGREVEISGRIDRLRIEAERITLIDFKTDQIPPVTAADIPETYRRQMALYRLLLGEIYGGRRIETLLLYTGNGRLLAV